MLIPRYLPVLGSGIEAGMTQVFLKKPQSVAGVVKLYRMYRKGISQPMRANVTSLSSFWVNQLG